MAAIQMGKSQPKILHRYSKTNTRVQVLCYTWYNISLFRMHYSLKQHKIAMQEQPRPSSCLYVQLYSNGGKKLLQCLYFIITLLHSLF